MAVYELRITERAAKELDALPRKKTRQAVADRILGLAENPHPDGCVKLSGQEPLYRIRQGAYRIVYKVEDACLIVLVVPIADRKGVDRKQRQRRSTERAHPFGKPH